MIFKKGFVLILTILFSLSVIAHEGHDTGAVKSMHGGVVKKSKNAYVEVLQDDLLEIYITNHNYKSLIAPGFSVVAVAEINNKKQPLKTEIKNDKVVILTDLKKEKHYKLTVSYKISGKDENVVFPLENE